MDLEATLAVCQWTTAEWLFLFSFSPYMLFSYNSRLYEIQWWLLHIWHWEKQNWFTNDWHKYFPEGIYPSHSPSLHITMQMSGPSYFGIYWNAQCRIPLLSLKWVFFWIILFLWVYVLATHQKCHLNI